MTESNCPKSETLAHYVDGRLESSEASKLKQHLDTCTQCSQLASKFESAKQKAMSGSEHDTVALEDQVDGDSEAGFDSDNARSSSTGFTTKRTQKLPPILAEGELLGQYRILKPLGRGGMGEVFQARHEKLDRIVALKTLTHAQVASAESMERFDREMKAVAKLDHPNIVRAYDANESDGVLYFVMEYLEGDSLARILRRDGRLSVPQACQIAQQIAIGLEHIHQNKLIHRDIKPANLIVTPDGTVKILDLGLALLIDRTISPTDLTQSGLVIGTPDFMANEQLEDMRSVDIRADVYSLGATLYAMLAGHAPFAGSVYQSTLKKIAAMATEDVPPITKLRDDIPVDLVNVLNRMLKRDPNERYQTPGEVVSALQPFVDQQAKHTLAKHPESRKLRGLVSVGVVMAAMAAIWQFAGGNKVPPTKPSSETESVAQPLEPLIPEFELSDPLPKLQNVAERLATALLNGDSDTALTHLKPAFDNTLRSYMIQSLSTRISNVDWVLDLADTAQPDVRSALLLCLAESESEIDADQAERLQKLYSEDIHGDVHSAARLLLVRKGFGDEVAKADATFAQRAVPDKGWFQTKTGHTMVIVPGPSTVFLGSPENEIGRFTSDPFKDESQRQVTIEHSFAFSIREVSHGQFHDSQPKKFRKKAPSVPDTAYGSCYWNEAAEYCNYLSAQEGLDESEFCYEKTDDAENFCIKQNSIQLSGYRLPTDEEWEMIARAGSSTSRHFGRDSGLLPKYCFGNENAGGHAYERGLLLPNALGVYDSLGNVSEWIHEAIPDGPRGLAYRVRGGSSWTMISGIRCAARYYVEWRYTSNRLGFRVARTIGSAE